MSVGEQLADIHSVLRGTFCECGAPVECLKSQQCRKCYKKAHASKRYYDAAKAKHPNWASMCQRGEHKKCSGWRGNGQERCACHCHLGICPTCHQPSDAKARVRLRNAAMKVKKLAWDLEQGLGA